MRDFKTVGNKVVNEPCDRCGGTGIFTWWTYSGQAGGVCFKCGGACTVARTVKPALTEGQQRKALSATGEITVTPGEGRMELRVGTTLIAHAKHLPDWAPSDQGLGYKADFINEVRELNGLSRLTVTTTLPEERVITAALVISTFLAADVTGKEAIQALTAELKADPGRLDPSRLADAQAIIDGLRTVVCRDEAERRFYSFGNEVALIATGEKVYPTQYGKLAYAAKVLEQAQRRAAETAQKVAESRWLGQAGEKVEIDLIVRNRRIYEGGYNRSDTVYYDCETPDGQLVQVKATTTMGIQGSGGWCPVLKGAHVRVQATVRELGDYQGRKQTQINRVKVRQIVAQGQEGF